MNMMSVSPIVIIAGVALLQWIAFALLSLFSERQRRFVVSTAAFALTWLVVLGLALPSKSAEAATTKASAAAAGGSGTCIAIERGMSSADVLAKAGKPDETRSDEETRGPGASIRIYRDGRCAVHMLGDTVEFVE